MILAQDKNAGKLLDGKKCQQKTGEDAKNHSRTGNGGDSGDFDAGFGSGFNFSFHGIIEQ